jgi:hypothetical protein
MQTHLYRQWCGSGQPVGLRLADAVPRRHRIEWFAVQRLPLGVGCDHIVTHL